MDYKIVDICNNLSIGKSTIYNRIEKLKQSIPKQNWKNNEYFYYDANNKLFITQKGFDYIENFKNNKNSKENRQNSTTDLTITYQTELIEMYKNRISYLEDENKRLLDIISAKEQRELAKDVKLLQEENTVKSENFSIFTKILNKFNKREKL